jgi:ubiquinone biosynthesis protein Coq4
MQTIRDAFASARTLASFVDLVRHPDHLDRVFEIADGMVKRRTEVLEKMRDNFAKHPRGASALRERPRLHFDLGALSRMPAGSLGRTFADHMRANGLDPSAIPTMTSNDELEFIRAHLYETHDVWHAVTGFHTDVAGELGLQACSGSRRSTRRRVPAGSRSCSSRWASSTPPSTRWATASAGSTPFRAGGRWADVRSRSSASAGTSSGSRPWTR